MYEILQEGGPNNQPKISATDQDFPPFWLNAGTFVTTQMFEWANEFDGIPNEYKDNEEEIIEALKLDLDEENSLQYDFTEAIFGNEARVTFEEFSKNVVKKTPWVLSSNLLRKKVFEKAKLTYKA